MSKNITLMGLVGVGITSLIGSSWLFTAEYSTKIAGYASIASWVIAAVMTFVIALSFMELSSILSTNGASSKIPTIMHGPTVGFLFAIFTWLSYLIFVPIESHAIIQYLAVYFPCLLDNNEYYIISGVTIVGLSCLLNLLSIGLISKINSYFTLAKIIVPVFVALFIIIYCFSSTHNSVIHNAPVHVLEWKWSNMFNAITMGGIAFSFIGFKTIIEIAGHAENPKMTIPLSIILVLSISLVIFLVVQYAYFVSAATFENVLVDNSLGAFGVVASNIGSNLFITILYFSAITFPFICGAIYMRVSIESLNVLIMENILQKSSSNKLHLKTFVAISFICSLIVFFAFNSWEKVSTFIAALMAITYLIGPIATIKLRKSLPDVHRPYRIKVASITCFLSFYFSSIILCYSGWSTIFNIICFTVICLVLFLILEKSRKHNVDLKMSRSLWFIAYILGMGLITYLISDHVSYEFNVLSQLGMVLVVSIVSYSLAFMNSLDCIEVADNYNNLV